MVPEVRVRALNDVAARNGRYVLYWMTAARRTRHSFALDHAVDRANDLGVPLVVLEALRVGYRWAADRHHRFVLDGMADNRARFAAANVTYHAYVEPTPGAGEGLLAAAAADAALVVTDDWPAFFFPRMLAAAARLPVRIEAVDGNGLLPMRAPSRQYVRAHDFRRMLARDLPSHLHARPAADPLVRVRGRRPALDLDRWPDVPVDLAELPIDHDVPPVPYRGGESAGTDAAAAFVDDGLSRYEERNHPDAHAASNLSPWLHWGHVGTHRIFAAIAERDRWTPERVGGADKTGWWGTSPEAAAYLDELVTWRELGFHTALWNDAYDRYDGLPAWARATLAKHADDPREEYDLATLEAARTGDAVWDAAQRELRTDGRIHNYLRMNWGKRLIGWSATPEAAFERLVHLNNKWAVDGRDPNSWSGIAWVFGRYDRPWPERPIFGTVRYMTSESTRRKLHLREYLARWA